MNKIEPPDPVDEDLYELVAHNGTRRPKIQITPGSPGRSARRPRSRPRVPADAATSSPRTSSRVDRATSASARSTRSPCARTRTSSTSTTTSRPESESRGRNRPRLFALGSLSGSLTCSQPSLSPLRARSPRRRLFRQRPPQHVERLPFRSLQHVPIGRVGDRRDGVPKQPTHRGDVSPLAQQHGGEAVPQLVELTHRLEYLCRHPPMLPRIGLGH